MGAEVPNAEIDAGGAEHGGREIRAAHEGEFQRRRAAEGLVADVV